MKKLIFFALIIQLVTGCKTESTNSNKSKLISFADSLFRANVDSSLIAGASVLVYQDGKMLLDKSYGYASLELSVPMPYHASFEIGSRLENAARAYVGNDINSHETNSIRRSVE